MNEDYNIDEEYDRYYMSNTIKENLNESNQNDYSSYLKVYNEDTDQDDVLLNMGNNVFTTISSQPSEKKEIVSGENTFTVPANQSDIGSNVNQNTFNKYLSQNYNVVPGMSLNLDDKNIQAVGKNILGGVAKGVDMFTDMTSDFTSKYIEVTNPALANLIRTGFQQDEVNVKDAVSSFFPEVNLEVLNPETDAGKTAQDIISLFTATALAPGSALPKAVGGMGAVGPEFGNVFTIFKEFGLENDVVNFLSSKLENPDDATLDERLVSRLKSIVDVPAEAAALFSVAKTLSAKGAQILGLATAGTITSAEVAEAGPLGKIVSSVLKKKTIKKSDLAKDNIFEGIAEVKAPTDNEPGIIAFHGSGADFDRFRLDKIGSGEGAQMFGYGLYFTEVEDIAKYYKNSLSSFTLSVKGKEHTIDPKFLPIPQLAKALGFENYRRNKDGSLDEILVAVGDAIRNNQSPLQSLEQSYKRDKTMRLKDLEGVTDVEKLRRDKLELRFLEEDYINNKNMLEELDIKVDNAASGKTYKVALSPKPEEFLDYDLPFSEQSAYVKKNLRNYKDVTLGDDPEYVLPHQEFKRKDYDFGQIKMPRMVFDAHIKKLDELLQSGADAPGSEIIKVLKDMDGTGQRGSQFLTELGIKGIKYRSAANRNPDMVDRKNKNNFVIFDENLINILAKYGIVGGVGITALGSSEESL